MDNLQIKDKLKEYIKSGQTGIYLETNEHERVDVIIDNISQELGSEVIEWNFGYGIVDFKHKQPTAGLDDDSIILSKYLPSLYGLNEDLGTKIILIKNINEIIASDLFAEPSRNSQLFLS